MTTVQQTYTVEVFVKHRHRDGFHVVTWSNVPARHRDEAVRRAEEFCGGQAVHAHNNNPGTPGGSKRG